MTDERSTSNANILRGAVSGLVAGVVASFAMDRFQALVTHFSGTESDAEPATAKAADAVSDALTGAPVAEANQPLAGQIVHYALGMGLGVAYGIAAEFEPDVTVAGGAAFGIGTAAALDETIVPALGLSDAPWKSGIGTHVYALASHLVFSTVTEFTRRQVRSSLTA